MNKGINSELQAKAVSAVEGKPTHVPRHMHCGVCEVFRGSESFKGQSDEGGVKVCDQCRKRRDTGVEEVVHPPQGMPLFTTSKRYVLKGLHFQATSTVMYVNNPCRAAASKGKVGNLLGVFAIPAERRLRQKQ